jgi:hypothetical protein
MLKKVHSKPTPCMGTNAQNAADTFNTFSWCKSVDN